MKVSCIINNYNYGRFLGEAIDSALKQTKQFCEVIVVDDGSTDDSRDVLKIYGDNPQVKILIKNNAGQLSAFNEGFKMSSGEWVCFLDSDDRYKPMFLEEMENKISENADIDFISCSRDYIDISGNRIRTKNDEKIRPDIDYGFTVAKTYYSMSYTGQPTSLNMLKRSIAEKILPFHMLEEFRVCADIVLVQGASLVGSRKYFYGKKLVEYRVHGENAYHSRGRGADVLFKEKLSKLRMMDAVLDKNIGISKYRLKEIIVEEYKTKPGRIFREFLIYLYATWSSELSLFRKVEASLKILKSHINKNGKMKKYVSEKIERC